MRGKDRMQPEGNMVESEFCPGHSGICVEIEHMKTRMEEHGKTVEAVRKLQIWSLRLFIMILVGILADIYVRLHPALGK